MISRKVLLAALQATALLPLLAKGQTDEEAMPGNKKVCLMLYSMAGKFVFVQRKVLDLFSSI